MALSKISICNIALASLGAEAIRSFEENNKHARMCEVFYSPLKQYLLSKFDWPFARRFTKLQQVVLDDDALPEGDYAYALPPDCETPRDLHPRGSKDKWEVIGTNLHCCKSTDVYLYYTANEVDSATFSMTFNLLLATLLAVKMSPAITQDKKITDTLYAQFKTELLECWESDANIGNEHKAFDDDPNNDTFINPDGMTEPDYGDPSA